MGEFKVVVRIFLLFFSLQLLFCPFLSANEVRKLRRHLNNKPDDWRRRKQLASALLKAGKKKEAEQELAKILDLRPYAHKLRCKLGVLLWRRGARKAAVKEWRQVVLHQPGNKLALKYLKKAGVPAVEKYRLRLKWSQKSHADHYDMEMAHQEEAFRQEKNILKANSSLEGFLLCWTLGKETKEKTQLALQTIIKKGKMPKGMFLPQPSVFGFPRAKTIQTRVIDERGLIHSVGGVEKRDLPLYEMPYFVLPKEEVSVGQSWQYMTSSTSFYLHSNLGTVEMRWTYELTAIKDGVAVIKGKCEHLFLENLAMGNNLKVKDGIEVGLHLKSGRLVSFVHNICQENFDKRSGVLLRIVDGIGLKLAPKKKAPKADVSEKLFKELPMPSTICPTEKGAKKFLAKFFEYLYYGHTDKLTLHCLDFHNLKDISGDHGLLYRNTSDDYRRFLVSRTLGNIQKLAAAVDADAASPAEIDKLVKERTKKFSYRSYGRFLRASDGLVAFSLHIINGKTRIVRIFTNH